MHFNRFTVVCAFTKSSNKPNANISGNSKFEPRNEECTTVIYNNPRKSEAIRVEGSRILDKLEKVFFHYC